MRIVYILLSFFLLANHVFAQKNFPSKYKFGNVTLADFSPNINNLDSNAQAVILFDKGVATYESDQEAWFNIQYVYHKKIRILNKNLPVDSALATATPTPTRPAPAEAAKDLMLKPLFASIEMLLSGR